MSDIYSPGGLGAQPLSSTQPGAVNPVMVDMMVKLLQQQGTGTPLTPQSPTAGAQPPAYNLGGDAVGPLMTPPPTSPY
jgi:hypothetical protein